MNLWTREDIAKILIQLDTKKLPFSKYALCQEKGELKLLGRGGSADVYEAQTRSSKKKKFAMKVIGFRNQTVDSNIFDESVQVQKDIGYLQNNVVKVYDHMEIWVTLDTKDNVVSAVKQKPEFVSRTTIKLQFVLMEKIESVIMRTPKGNIRMLPENLSYGEESEILKIAYDIGMALKNAHKKNVLHRDVKLENVFYSEKTKQYKLGDFGIAKKTEDGFARTIAFTKGYAAPEVRMSDERYDNTADIYSFGMMLYVLANHLKFPDSNTYNVNTNVQYTPGYVVPKPEYGISDELYQVIARACMYDADERYQSMEEILLEIEKLMYNENLGYKKEHKNSGLVVGTIMLALGVVAWKLTFVPSLRISISLGEYIFLLCCLGKGVTKAFGKDVTWASVMILGVGIYLMVGSGFSGFNLVILLWMTFTSGISAGYLSAGVLIADFISLIQEVNGMGNYFYSEYRWIAIIVISIAVVLLYEYKMLIIEDRKIANIYYKKGLYWAVIILAYGTLLLSGLLENSSNAKIYRIFMGDEMANIFLSFDRKKVGFYGLCFCLFWLIRENILIYRQKVQNKRRNK